jgi:hypothetical protein
MPPGPGDAGERLYQLRGEARLIRFAVLEQVQRAGDRGLLPAADVLHIDAGVPEIHVGAYGKLTALAAATMSTISDMIWLRL